MIRGTRVPFREVEEKPMNCKAYLTSSKSLRDPIDVQIFSLYIGNNPTSHCRMFFNRIRAIWEYDSYSVYYVDDDNDFVSMNSDRDFNMLSLGKMLKFCVVRKVEDEDIGKVNEAVSSATDAKSNESEVIHSNVLCHGCGTKNIQGNCYKCLECDDFVLCSLCEIKEIHFQHVMVRFPKTCTSLYINNLKSLLSRIVKENAGKF